MFEFKCKNIITKVQKNVRRTLFGFSYDICEVLISCQTAFWVLEMHGMIGSHRPGPPGPCILKERR